MKKRDKDELHAAGVTELGKKAGELRKKIAEVRLTMQTKEVKNRREAKELRRKLAALLSIKREKELTEKKVGTV
jgi:ribosomal protein L29